MIYILGFEISYFSFSFLVGLWVVMAVLGFQGIRAGKFIKKGNIKKRITTNEVEQYLQEQEERSSRYGQFYSKNLSNHFKDGSILSQIGRNIVPDTYNIKRQLDVVGKDVTVEEFISMKVLSILFGVSFLGTGMIFGMNKFLLGVGALLLLLGLTLEEQLFGEKIKKRNKELERGLPNFLDLLHSASLSGHTITEAIIKVSSKFDGLVATEFNKAMIDFKGNGGDLKEALNNMAERNGNEALSNVIADILIAYEKGDDQIIETLKAEANMMRELVSADADERANRKASSLLLPMMVFFFMPLMAFILLPMFAQFVTMME